MKVVVTGFAILLLVGVIIMVLRRGPGERGNEVGESVDGAVGGGEDGEDRDIRTLVEPLLKPAVLIKTTEDESGSYFGGLPPGVESFEWPERDGRAMGFLACLDLSLIPAVYDWLPRSGRLLFFYDMEEQPWGFDPKDRGGWAVLHVGARGEGGEAKAAAPASLAAESLLKSRGIRFESASLPPSWEEEVLEPLKLSDGEHEALWELRDSLTGEGASHQIGGYPDPIQYPQMPLECQLASNGLYCGDSSWHEDPRAEALKPGAKDWQLLLQMDSDDDLGVMWGDSGIVYFWVRAEDARRGDFSNVWLILQCF